VNRAKKGGYIYLDWTPERLKTGIVIKLKKVPFKVKLFKRVATNGDIDLALTNGLDDSLTVQVAKEANDVRWQIAPFHREIKQLTGSENANAGRLGHSATIMPAATRHGFP
jgi:hypothetical protein